MKSFKYIQPKKVKSIEVVSSLGVKVNVDIDIIENALKRSHNTIDKFTDFDVNVFEILGMRNLSAFIGEVFVASMVLESKNLFVSNPHQDGYPDLLLMNKDGKDMWAKLQGQLKSKEPFSPFENGGIEVKSTCGSVPTPKECAKKGIEKPGLGDQRISVLKGYDWKAHHRETNNLMSLIWDFIDGVPRIVAVFYSGQLVEEDWGKIVKPKAGGGRTTSVSIMSRAGVKKMYEGTVFVMNDKSYIDFLNKYNKDSFLKVESK